MIETLYSGTVESIGDGFSTKNLTIDPPILKLTISSDSSSDGEDGGDILKASSSSTTEEFTLTDCTWEDDKLKYPMDSNTIASRYALVAFENGVPVTVTVFAEYESSGGGQIL